MVVADGPAERNHGDRRDHESLTGPADDADLDVHVRADVLVGANEHVPPADDVVRVGELEIKIAGAA